MINKEYLKPEYVNKLLADAENRAKNMFTMGGIEAIEIPEAERAIGVLEKIKNVDCTNFKDKIQNIKAILDENRKKLNNTNLDNYSLTDEKIRHYISSIDKRYTGFGFDISDVSEIKREADLRFNVIPNNPLESRVIVYNILTKNNSDAFATIGWLIFPQITENIYSKSSKFYQNPENAAKMHLYYNFELDKDKLRKTGIGRKKLAKILEIPRGLQI